MQKELFIKLYNDLNKLDPNKITVVTYEDTGLVYRQIGKVISIPYLGLYFYPPSKGWKFGVLTQSGFMKLNEQLLKLIQDPRLEEGMLFVPIKFGTLGLVEINEGKFRGPQELYHLNYVNITNRYYAKFLLSRYDSESKLLSKYITDLTKSSK